jgi:tRNA dimethylallyltransferase
MKEGFEIAVIDARGCGGGHARLRAKRDPEARGFEHRQIVGAVADGERRPKWDRVLGREREERLPLLGAREDRFLDPGHPPFSDLEPVGDDAIEAEKSRHLFRKEREPSRNEGQERPFAPHGGDERASPAHQADLRRRLFERRDRQSSDEGEASLERRLKVDLAIHGAAGDCGHLRGKAETSGELVEHLVLDDRPLEIGDEEALSPRARLLRHEIDRHRAEDTTRAGQGRGRRARLEEKVAGFAGGKPPRLRGEFGREPPSAAFQGTRLAAVTDERQNEAHLRSPSAEPSSGPPVVLLAGPTASGKSVLAEALAESFPVTIINADSQQVYRDLRVLSAHPDATAEARIPHRLYGFLDAAERSSAGLWRSLAEAAIAESASAGRVALVVGGSGLYLRALEQGLAPIPAIPEEIRREGALLYERLGGEGFRDRLSRLDRESAERLPAADRARLLRAYEVVRATGLPIGKWREKPRSAPAYRLARILVMPPRERLYAECDARFLTMTRNGALAEAAALAARSLDPRLPAMKALGLGALLAHLRGEMTLAEAVAAGQRATRRYAKRQVTWFRHQFDPDRVVGEEFSQGLLSSIGEFIDGFLLTGRV